MGVLLDQNSRVVIQGFGGAGQREAKIGRDYGTQIVCGVTPGRGGQVIEDTPIRNTRQASIVSAEELAEIARRMGLPEIKPDWLGANLVLSGIPRFTMLPGSTRLIFSSGASLVVDTENAPCRFPAEVIDRHHPGSGPKFVPNAQHLRGVTGWVEREGWIRRGDSVAVHLPPQRIYEITLERTDDVAA